MAPEDSLATRHRSLADPSITYPLEPAPTAGCSETSTDEIQYPVGVDYDYDAVDTELFDPTGSTWETPGLERWQPLLPPLAADTLGEGNTPLLPVDDLAEWLGFEAWLESAGESTDDGGPDRAVFLKDESQNPTWSHKDRLNRCTVSAAVRESAAGVVASSTGNHGAAAAAYAARAGLPCVVFTAPQTPAAVQAFIRSYGAVVLAVDDIDVRQEAVDRLTETYGFHPVSSRTAVHTGHAWGPEGYKTIAYELYCQFGGSVPGTVVIPTCYAELLYGVWKGFRELEGLGVVDRTPRLVASEPGVRAPLCHALESGAEVAHVEAEPTEAYSIKATTSSVRGLRAIHESDGLAVGFSELHLEAAQHGLARTGFWQESSGAAGIAGLRALVDVLEGECAEDDSVRAVTADGNALEAGTLELEAPVAVVATSSGFKDGAALPGDRMWEADDRREDSEGRHRSVGGWFQAPAVDPTWEAIREALESHDGVPV
ncbi:threonine synthase [Natrialbaceae archaeon A-CW2]|uniref:threonine synthase n=1 Tax=Natronosalvus amylolyticus TaxID=2961994 RepID=UPI0020C96BD2|nr:pyridoxal-phosphate dependent enzyme [Natronosalvus amylolyticus]